MRKSITAIAALCLILLAGCIGRTPGANHHKRDTHRKKTPEATTALIKEREVFETAVLDEPITLGSFSFYMPSAWERYLEPYPESAVQYHLGDGLSFSYGWNTPGALMDDVQAYAYFAEVAQSIQTKDFGTFSLAPEAAYRNNAYEQEMAWTTGAGEETRYHRMYNIAADACILTFLLEDTLPIEGDSLAFFNSIVDNIAVAPRYTEGTDWYTEGVYRVGEGEALPPGEYFVLSPNGCTGTVELFPNDMLTEASRITRVDVVLSTYITVEEGECIKLTLGKLCSVSEVENIVFSSEDIGKGTYRVGRDIPEGSYSIIADDTADYALVRVLGDSRHTPESIVAEEMVAGTVSFDLREGQYISIENGRIRIPSSADPHASDTNF